MTKHDFHNIQVFFVTFETQELKILAGNDKKNKNKKIQLLVN